MAPSKQIDPGKLTVCSVIGFTRIVTYARQSLVSLQDTPYYHCVARCVRRAWLWGFDQYAGRDYSHRKAWVVERIAKLTSIFAIDIYAYAIMSQQEVVERWSLLFSIPAVVERWQQGVAGEAECEVARKLIERWRERLYDISWFMRGVNEYLARRANAEDDCKGRFWEGRFKSQALLDEAGVLTAMAYVDLNPIRAGIAETPEASLFTSIKERIEQWRNTNEAHCASIDAEPRVPLRALRGAGDDGNAIPYQLNDYLQLVDWTGRAIRLDKRGFIDEKLPPIMQRLGIDTAAWAVAMRPAGNVFGRAMGKLNHLRLHAKTLGQSWIRGLKKAERLYAR